MIKIEYENVDITKKVSINTCVHDMYAENKADSLLLRVNDVSGLWDKWQPQNGDKIKATYGAINTGTMYVHECQPRAGWYTLKATAAPPTFGAKSNKAWQQVRFLQIGQEIASRHGLKFKSYGVSDQLYRYILQSNQDDFSFYAQRCALEGCSMIICDETLIVYSQVFMEQQQPVEFLDLAANTDFDFRDHRSRCFGACDLEKGAYHGTFKKSDGPVYRPNEAVYIGSNCEAHRFAKNLLRDANKNGQTGFIRGEVLPSYAAGSTAVIKNTANKSWDGTIFLTHVRNDYGNCRSKLFFRKPLEGY